MIDDEQAWTPLLNASLPKLPSQVKVGRVSKAERLAAEKQLWVALDANNVKQAIEALNTGANVGCMRSRISPIVYAFSNNQVEMAEILFEFGADTQAIDRSKLNLFQIATLQHSIQLVNLLALRGFVFEDNYSCLYALRESSTVTQWWLDQGLSLKATPRNHWGYNGKKFLEWMGIWSGIARLNLHTPLMGQITHQMQKEEPGLFEREEWKAHVFLCWKPFLEQDNAQSIQILIQHGWTPCLKCWALNRGSGQNRERTLLSPTWVAALNGSFQCVDFLCQAPLVDETLKKEAVEAVESLFERAPLNGPILELLHSKLGLDVFGLHGRTMGSTLLHERLSDLTKGFLEWAVRNHPDWVWEKDKNGETIFERLRKKEGKKATQWEDFATRIRIKRGVGKASRKKVDQKPIRKRL